MRSPSLFRRFHRIAWPCLGLLFCLSAALGANTIGVPNKLNYQGQLTDNLGNALNGPYTMTFSLYDDVAAGSMIWQETQNNVNVTKGLFNAILGTVTPLNLVGVYPNGNEYLWLAVRVAPDVADMTPRHQLLPAAYALDAASLQGTSLGNWGYAIPQLDPTGHLPSSELPMPFDVTGTVAAGDVMSAKNFAGDANAEGFFASGYTGVSATSTSTIGAGIYGYTAPGDNSSAKGVWGQANAGYGVMGSSNTGAGVYGLSNGSGFGNVGVYGKSTYINGYGVQGTGYYGVYGYSNNGYGGLFYGPNSGVFAEGGDMGVYCSSSGYSNFYSDAVDGQYGFYGYSEAGEVGYFDASQSGNTGLHIYGGTPALKVDNPNGVGIVVSTANGTGVPGISITANTGAGIKAWGYKYNSPQATGVYGYGYHGLVGVGSYVNDDSATGVSGTTEYYFYGTGVYASGYYGMKISSSYYGLIIGGETYWGGNYLQSPSTGIRVSSFGDAIEIPSAGICGVSITSATTGLWVGNASSWGADLSSNGGGVRVNSLTNGLDVQVNGAGYYGLKVSSTAAGIQAFNTTSYYGGVMTTYYQGIDLINNGTSFGFRVIDYNTGNANPTIWTEARGVAGTAVYARNTSYSPAASSSGSALQVTGRLKVTTTNAGIHNSDAGGTTHTQSCIPCQPGDVVVVSPTTSGITSGLWWVSGPDVSGTIYVYTANPCAFYYHYLVIAK
jgi:hypothetical protein